VIAQTSPRHTVFTGRVLSVGRPVNAWSSPWALVQVEHVYWGLPHWMRWIVFVRGYFKDTDKGQEYLVDAHRSEGALTRFLPVVEFYPCCHTVPLSYAQVDLRVLHDGPPKSGVRIIGRVYRVLGGKPGWMFIQGVPVTVTGPVGSVSVVTDESGIYDLRDLPQGYYSVRLGSDEHGTNLKSGDVWDYDLRLRNDLPAR